MLLSGDPMRPGSVPMSQLILWDIFLPPVVAGFWWLMAGGWAIGVQGGKVSKDTKSRQRAEFWGLLCLAYVILFGFTLYDWLT